MRLYLVTMLHPNANANQVWKVRARNKHAALYVAHDEMVRRNVFFQLGDVVPA